MIWYKWEANPTNILNERKLDILNGQISPWLNVKPSIHQDSILRRVRSLVSINILSNKTDCNTKYFDNDISLFQRLTIEIFPQLNPTGVSKFSFSKSHSSFKDQISLKDYKDISDKHRLYLPT